MNRRLHHAAGHATIARYGSLRVSAAGALVILAALLLKTAQTGEVRTWSSSTGTYKTVAKLVQVKDNGTVVLRKQDGSVVEVPLSRLSAADQEFVRLQSSGGADLPPPTGSATTPPKPPEEIEEEAQECRTAKEAVLVYTFYLSKPNLSVTQRAAATAKLAEWKKKAEQGQVRLGREWMTKKEADEIRRQADAKIEHAMEMLRLNNGEMARKSLEEASKLDPDSIQADFLMGVVYGLIADNDRKAQLHFEKCLRREPGNVSVLNNLAVSLVFQKKYAQAAEHWTTAAATAPKMKALSQNIGSLIAMAGTTRLKIPSRTQQELSRVYEDLITTHGNPRPTRIAFVYTPPYGAGWNSKAGDSPGPRGKKESVIVSSGSGFVVHPHVILTNRHVVDGASGLLVVDPKNTKADPLPAELIAISDKFDLALVRCRGLDAPPVKLVEKLPPRGSDIMVLGYPLGPSFGTALKSTRGAMVAMPDASIDNMCLYDAVTNPGNSGGPLCDKAGRVAGVVRAVTGGIGGSYGAAIPIADALPFVRQHVPDLAPSATDADEVDWPAVDARVSPSTVLILTKEDLQNDAGVGDGLRG